MVQRISLRYRHPHPLAQPAAVWLHSHRWRVSASPTHQKPGGPGAKYYNDPIYKWQIDVAGYFGIDTSDTNRFPRKEWPIIDTVRWSRGKHELTFGGDYSRGRNDIIDNFRANGQWSFNGSATFTTDSLADFLTGRYNSLQQGQGEYKNTIVRYVGLCVQDSMKFTRRFTLNAGMRWEPFQPLTDENNKIAVWHPDEQSRHHPHRLA